MYGISKAFWESFGAFGHMVPVYILCSKSIYPCPFLFVDHLLYDEFAGASVARRA